MKLRTLRDLYWSSHRPWASLRTFLVPQIARALHSCLMCTLRVTTSDMMAGHHYVSRQNDGPGALFPVWHDVMWMPLYLFQHRDIGVIVSHSRSGQMAAAVWNLYGWPIIFGSRGKREGITALRAAIDRLREGRSVGFTPDGPTGPRHHCQPGLVYLAATAPAVIMPVGVAAQRGWRLKTWDKFLIPRPFTRVHIHVGAPLEVPPEAARENVKSWQIRIDDAMNEAMRSAQNHLEKQ